MTNPIELVKGSRYFRPTCIAANRAEKRENVRSWYVTDWVDGRYNVHGYGRVWKLEIDLSQAIWKGPLELPSSNEEALVAQRLRSGEHDYPLQELLKLSQTDDPYLAQASLVALSKITPAWKVSDAQKSPTHIQSQMLLALRIAVLENEKSVDIHRWIKYFLTVPDQKIQFETFRLISDLEFKQYLPKVEKILSQSDLSYELFEAAVATLNTLNGKPEIGVRNEELLLTRVQDTASSPKLRAYALRLLPARNKQAADEKNAPRTSFPKGLSLKLLNELIDVEDIELSLADSHLKCNGSELSSGSDGMGFEAVYCWKVNTAGSWIVVRTMHYSTENLRCRTTSLLLKNAKSSLSYIIRALVRQRSLST